MEHGGFYYIASKSVHFTSNWCPLDQILKPKHKSLCVCVWSGPGPLQSSQKWPVRECSNGSNSEYNWLISQMSLASLHSSNRLKKNVQKSDLCDACLRSHMGVTSIPYLLIAIECAQHDSAPVWCDREQSHSLAVDFRWDEFEFDDDDYGGLTETTTSATSSPGRVIVFARNHQRNWCQLAWRRNWAFVSNYFHPFSLSYFCSSSRYLLSLWFILYLFSNLMSFQNVSWLSSSGQVSMCQLSSALFHPVLSSVCPLSPCFFLKTHSPKTLSAFNVQHTRSHTHTQWTESAASAYTTSHYATLYYFYNDFDSRLRVKRAFNKNQI